MEEHISPSSPGENAGAFSASALRELQERAHAALSASREQSARLEAELTRQLDELAATLNEQVAAESQHSSQAELLRAEIARLNSELETNRAAWLAERTGLEACRDELAGKVAALESQLHSSQDEWRKQLHDFENRLREQQTLWNEQRSDWSLARTGLERERDELRQKFDLALEDVQRLRARVAELEQDLARRPEPNQVDSAELVALRAERDALSARVEQLEQRPAAPIDLNGEQQLADLQRRFELAVEDVRELKTKNAKLESQLAAAASRSHPPADSGGTDWESQKRRLLASLQDGEEGAAISNHERATIEGTIEITDSVVAEKDRQIAELQAQLAAGNEGAACQLERDAKIKELIDADEVIAEHRKRVRELELEMEQKLRTAELELSVERAKMARQKMELDERRSELESQRQAFELAGGPPSQGQPRRRWLAQLGLKDEE
jgi:chromosome segregation ATPase